MNVKKIKNRINKIIINKIGKVCLSVLKELARQLNQE